MRAGNRCGRISVWMSGSCTMAILDIVLYPDDPLTRAAEPYESVEPEAAALAADMFETMDTFDGSGLSGPQVGVTKRIFVLRDPETGRKICLINPELSEMEGNVEGEEGCLSLPYVYANVRRAQRVRVRGLDLHGQPVDFVAEDWLGRIIQHETDHLHGTVFLDRLDILSREDKVREWQRVRESMLAAAEGG